MSQVKVKSEIRDLRDWYGMTQAQFAHAVGVSERAVIRWEGGEVEPLPTAKRSLALLEEVRERLIRRYGDHKAQEWLRHSLRPLRGNTPFEVLIAAGPVPVRDLLVGAESGAYR